MGNRTCSGSVTGPAKRMYLVRSRRWFEASGDDDRPDSDDYRKLEAACGPAVAWLLINTLVKANVIAYGTSPRFAWLTKEGVALRGFLAGKTVEQLVGTCCTGDEHDYCGPTWCNCGPSGHEAGRKCQNPFWVTR
jgi:hypothetical protein